MLRVCADLAHEDAEPAEGRVKRWERRLAPWGEMAQELPQRRVLRALPREGAGRARGARVQGAGEGRRGGEAGEGGGAKAGDYDRGGLGSAVRRGGDRRYTSGHDRLGDAEGGPRLPGVQARGAHQRHRACDALHALQLERVVELVQASRPRQPEGQRSRSRDRARRRQVGHERLRVDTPRGHPRGSDMSRMPSRALGGHPRRASA